MRQRARSTVGVLGVVATGSALLVVFGAVDGGQGARIGACGAVVVIVAALWRRFDVVTSPRSSFEASLVADAVEPIGHPADLEQIERLVRFPATVGDVHFRLRPVLRDIARHRVRAAKGLDLDHDVMAVRALLGEELAELVRADRSAPVDRLRTSSMGLREVAGYVHILEGL